MEIINVTYHLHLHRAVNHNKPQYLDKISTNDLLHSHLSYKSVTRNINHLRAKAIKVYNNENK